MFDLISDAISVFLIFSIWSIALYRPTKLSRIGALTFTATVISNLFVITINTIYSTLIIPLIQGKVILLIPLIFGILILVSIYSRYAWVAQFGIALMTGIGTGLAIRGSIESNIVQQMVGAIVPLAGVSGMTAFNNLFKLITTICVIMYFLFSYVPRTPGTSSERAFKYLVTLGKYGIMLTFGALYATFFSLRIGVIITPLEKVLRFFHILS